MNIPAVKDYPDSTSVTKSSLDANSSVAKMLSLVGSHKRVVDFGCATGYFAKLLVEQDCKVVGVEINPEAAKVAKAYCEDVVIADLDRENVTDVLRDHLSHQKFDVATFGDVLEHLKDPWRLLEAVKDILSPDGFVVASIPNIAHGSVRLALLEGAFDYQDAGLLDNTHLRFFTRSSVAQLFKGAGYSVQAEDAVHCEVFNSTPYTPNIDRAQVSDALIEKVLKDKDAEILQFIVRAYPWSPAFDYLSLKAECAELKAQVGTLSAELNQSKASLHQSKADLHRLQQDWQHSQNVIEQMATSKFWKIRQAYLQIKNKMGWEKSP